MDTLLSSWGQCDFYWRCTPNVSCKVPKAWLSIYIYIYTDTFNNIIIKERRWQGFHGINYPIYNDWCKYLFSASSCGRWKAMMKKDGTQDLGKLLLEEVFRSYFTSDDARIPSIRNSEDSINWFNLHEFWAQINFNNAWRWCFSSVQHCI